MRKQIAAAFALAFLVAVNAAGAKDWTKNLDSKDEAKRARAAEELWHKAVDEGLIGDEIEALAIAVDDPSDDVALFAIKALASNSKISTSQQYAPDFANRGNNFVAFLLWTSIYNTYSQFIEAAGGTGEGDMNEEMDYAEKEAERAFDNMLDPQRKGWAEPYVEEIFK
jgi:hypothetical protein